MSKASDCLHAENRILSRDFLKLGDRCIFADRDVRTRTGRALPCYWRSRCEVQRSRNRRSINTYYILGQANITRRRS